MPQIRNKKHFPLKKKIGQNFVFVFTDRFELRTNVCAVISQTNTQTQNLKWPITKAR